MQYIAAFEKKSVSVSQARDGMEKEYYNTPSGYCNGTEMGTFSVVDGKVVGLKHIWRGNSQVSVKIDTWIEKVVRELLSHLGVEEVRVGAGYQAYFSEDYQEVLAESYVARSGNAVVLVHKTDETLVCVSSRRHGIPVMANQFFTMHPHREEFYGSERTDRKWYESGLADEESARYEEGTA